MCYALRPATIDDYDFVYQVKTSTTKDYVARTWGWNEADQQARSAHHSIQHSGRLCSAAAVTLVYCA